MADRRTISVLLEILLETLHWTGRGTMSLMLVTSDLKWMGPLDGIAALGKLQMGSEASRLRAIDKGL